MKKFKKIMAVLVAAIMVVAMTVPAWAAGEVKLTYDDNGGKDGPGVIDVTPNTTYTINSTTPTHDVAADGTAIVFIGWTENDPPYDILTADAARPTTYFKNGGDGTGGVYGTTTLYADKTLHALWGYDYNSDGVADVTENGNAFTIHFDPEGGSGAPADFKIKKGPFKFYHEYPTKNDRIFVGWTKTDPTTDLETGAGLYYERGTDYFLNGDTDSSVTGPGTYTYYALWSKDENHDGVADCFQTNITIHYNLDQATINAKSIVRDFTVIATKADEYKIQGTSFVPSAPANPTGSFHDDVHDTLVKVAFIGWSEDSTARDTLYYRGDPSIPAVYDIYTVAPNATGTINLYPVWGVDVEEPIGTADIVTDANQGNIDTVEISAHNIVDGIGGVAGAEEHTAYKIFDVTKTDSVQSTWMQTNIGSGNLGTGTQTGIAYTIDKDSAWLSALQDDSQTWVNLTPSTDGKVYIVTWRNSNTNNENGAKAFATYLNNNIPSGNPAPKKITFSTGQKQYTTPGYYLVTSSLGTNLILATSSMKIKDKNQYVTDQKFIKRDNASVGSKVTYFVQVAIPTSVDHDKSITMFDILDERLSFDSTSIKYKVVGSPLNADDFKSEDFPTGYSALTENYVLDANKTDDYTFKVEIKLSQFASATETKYVIIGYEAELRSTAEADTTYKNTEYSQYSKYKTEPTSVNVQTFDVKFKKVDSTSNGLLDGAFFELRKDAEDGTPVKFIANTFYLDEKYSSKVLDTTSQYKAASATAKVADTLDNNFTTKLAAGELRISGLGAGKYYLVETSAPKGYNMLEKPIEITIGAGGEQTIKYSGETDTTKYLVNEKTRQIYDEFLVVNTAGTALPSTGGMGTTVLYIVGGMLVILAGAYLFFSRKRTA